LLIAFGCPTVTLSLPATILGVVATAVTHLALRHGDHSQLNLLVEAAKQTRV
jgi:hypothetical protein